MTEPTTPTGKRLLAKVAAHPVEAIYGANYEAYILAIEREAAQQERELLRAKVVALPQRTRLVRPRYTDEEGNARTDYGQPPISRPDGRISRSDVLAILRDPEDDR